MSSCASIYAERCQLFVNSYFWCISLNACSSALNRTPTITCIVGNSLADFQDEHKALQEVEIIVFAGDAATVADLWPHFSRLRWIHSLAAGVEGLVPVLNSLPGGPDIPLTNAKGAFSRSLAEYSLAAMLHFNKQIPRLQGNRSTKTWDKFIMNELHGQTVGFLGFGDIAQCTARLCKAFGMRILAWRNTRGASGEELADEVFYSSDGPGAKQEHARGCVAQIGHEHGISLTMQHARS